MPKIPKVTGWNRVKNFLKGLVLYNTVYWERASDGLEPPKISREERTQLRPKRDFTFIKPREKPRARYDKEEVRNTDVAPPPAPVPPPPNASIPPLATAPPAAPVQAAAPEPVVEVRKRRKRRKVQGGVRRSNPFRSESSGGSVKKWFHHGD